jgi:hypothetical protein
MMMMMMMIKLILLVYLTINVSAIGNYTKSMQISHVYG